MVKEYRRPCPGKIMIVPSELRPVDVLLKTVNHLFRKLAFILVYKIAAVLFPVTIVIAAFLKTELYGAIRL